MYRTCWVPRLRNCISKHRTLSSSNSVLYCKKTVRSYNIPHPPKDPPDDYQVTCVNHKAFRLPDFVPATVFRQFKCPEEILGPDANKDGCYKNPEYFGYHRYSFVALQLCTLHMRLKCVCENEKEGDCEPKSNSKKEADACKNPTKNGEKK